MKDEETLEAEDDLETDLENEDLDDEVDDDLEPINFDYSLHEEEHLMRNFYNNSPVDYIKLWYDGNPPSAKFALEGEYLAHSANLETEQEMITTEEAEQTFVNIQYATVLGVAHNVDSTERRKFDFWIKFNPALFGLFESLHSVTKDVNYKPLV